MAFQNADGDTVAQTFLSVRIHAKLIRACINRTDRNVCATESTLPPTANLATYGMVAQTFLSVHGRRFNAI
jgi:hypothetical protein